MSGWIVCLESGVWLAPWVGDPGRTLVESSAKRFPTKGAAIQALRRARMFRAFPIAAVAARTEETP